MGRFLDRLRKRGGDLSSRIFPRRQGLVAGRKVRVVTDSTSDLPPEIAEEYGITVVACNVLFGEEVYRDNIDISRDEFYRRMMTDPVVPTTSQPSVEEFRQVYENLSQETDQIVSIHLADELSGTLNSTRLAAREFPGVDIAIIDSRTATMALGILALQAARAANEGRTLAEIVTLVEGIIPRLRVLATLDTLKYVQRTGRIGKAAALLGNLLNLKPIVQIYYGEVLPVEKVRTKKRALRRLAELTQQMGPIEEMAVLHSYTPREAQDLVELLKNFFPPERIIIAEAGSVVGAHAGPGAVGVAFVQAKGETPSAA